MPGFIDENFLLRGETARHLYHTYAAKIPIVDYHCHIDAAEIYEDKRFADLSEVWLSGDHYKWRLMRACGVEEKYITGEACGRVKFAAFASCLPRAAGNPVYHWAHMELQRFFGITTPLGPDTAQKIWEKTSKALQRDETLSARGIIGRMDVEVIVTTDDPADSLEWHRRIAVGGLTPPMQSTRVLPCFRPDAALNIEGKGFYQYIVELGESSGTKIKNYDDLKQALQNRIKHFADEGCKAADHGIYRLKYAPASSRDIKAIFKKALNKEPLNALDADKYRYALLRFLAGEYVINGWVMELHLGVLRNVNKLAFDKTGANTGFDCMGTSIDIAELSSVLNAFDKAGVLPKTLIFPINPVDNAAVNVLAGCFAGEGIKSRVQQGSAWWFNDSLGGIRQQLKCFAENGVLGNFVGMLTDSRSFMSYTRHEYFRRILCDFLGRLADTGQYPTDIDSLSKLVEDICYNNVKEYFGV